MISVPGAPLGRIAHSAEGHSGGTSGLHPHRIRKRKTLMTWSPLTDLGNGRQAYRRELNTMPQWAGIEP
jgi:hypothetical protein